MHEQDMDVAGSRQCLDRGDLLERQRLQPGHEERIAARQVFDAHALRRARLRDPLADRLPHAKLPGVVLRQGIRRPLAAVIASDRHGAERRAVFLPQPDHRRPTVVVGVEQARNPSRDEQRFTNDVERNPELGGARPGDDIEHGERQRVERPGIGFEAAGRLQKRGDRCRVRDVDVGDDAVFPIPAAEPSRQPVLQPRLCPGGWHHDPRSRKEIVVTVEKCDRVVEHLLQSLDEGDLQRHLALPCWPTAHGVPPPPTFHLAGFGPPI